MLFNNFKKVNLGYFIKHNNLVPKFLFQDISQNIGCPATKSLHNRLYEVKPLVSVTIEFYVNENDVPVYNYLFDTNKFRDSEEVYNLLDEIIVISNEKGKAALQVLSYIHLVTDCKDLEITQLEPTKKNYENCEFVVGSFYPYEWIRMLNISYIQKDKNKKSVIHLNIDEPAYRILTSRKVNFKQIPYTDKIKSYEENSFNIGKYYKNVKNVSKRLTQKRPKHLL